MTRPGRRWGRLPVDDPAPRRWRTFAPRATGVALGIALAATAPAGAQIPTLPGPTTTTAPPPTTTTAPPPTTAAPPPDGEPPPTAPPADTPDTTSPPAPGEEPGGAAPPPTTAPGTPGAPAPPPAPGAVPPAPGQPPPAAAAPGVVPDDARRTINSVRRSGANSTRRLLAALAPLRDLGFSEQEVVAAGFGRFPVGGEATFSHDWLFPRFTPTFHLHQGTDIFAATGTPVRSPAQGTLRLAQGGSGGLAAYVYQADGTYFYMAHLSAFVEGQRPGQAVKVGEIVGFVGDSGNAEGGSPHVHFEIHPAPTRAVVSGRGRDRTVTHVVRPVPVGSVLPAMDPKSTLDQWLADALAAVPPLIASAEGRPRALAATAITRRAANGRSASFAAPVAPPRSQLLWASSASPSGGAVQLAEAVALVAASEFDWSEAARRQQEIQGELTAARARAAAILGPLTPPPLRPPPADDA